VLGDLRGCTKSNRPPDFGPTSGSLSKERGPLYRGELRDEGDSRRRDGDINSIGRISRQTDISHPPLARYYPFNPTPLCFLFTNRIGRTAKLIWHAFCAACLSEACNTRSVYEARLTGILVGGMSLWTGEKDSEVVESSYCDQLLSFGFAPLLLCMEPLSFPFETKA
jgi:hypothetical protein